MARFRVRYRVFAKHDGVNCAVKDYCDVDARDSRQAVAAAGKIATEKYNRLEKPIEGRGDEDFDATEMQK